MAAPPAGTSGRLHVLGDQRHVPFRPHAVEDLADHVEGGRQVRAADAEVEAHGLAHLGLERVVAGDGAHGAVEHDVVGSLVDGLDHAERLEAGLSIGAPGVEVALHHVVLAVHLRQAVLGLDQDQAVHAVGDVHGHGAVAQ